MQWKQLEHCGHRLKARHLVVRKEHLGRAYLLINPGSPKAAINRAQSKRFAMAGRLRAARSVWTACGFSAAVRLRHSLSPKICEQPKNISLTKTNANTMKNTTILSMNLLGAPASRRPVGNGKLELAGETPALPGTALRFTGSKREFVRGILTLTLALGFAGRGLAVDFHCVTAQDLQNALTLAAANGADDNIYLTNGYYIGNFNFNSTGGHNLTVQAEPHVADTAAIPFSMSAGGA